MNIKQALKQKNKLVGQIKEQYEIAKSHNSVEQGNIRRYSVMQALAKASELTNELVELKAKIHKANSGVYPQIFALSELKNVIKHIKSIPVDEGKVTERYGSITTIKEVELNIADRDNMIKSIEAQCEQLQDLLDTHNAITELE